MIKTGTAYHLVAESLRNQILGGQFKPGSQLPTEQELCRRFATSRITIRRALQILEEELLVQRRQGSGTFLAPSPTRKIPILNIGFFNSMTRHAPDLRRRLERWEWTQADSELAGLLETAFGERVLYARRVDVLKGKPIAMDDVYLLGRDADRLGEAELADLDFLARWEHVQNVAISHCRQTVEAVAADATVAKLLGVRIGTPVLRETDVMYLRTGRAAAVFVSHYRSDQFQFSATVRFSGHTES